MRHGDIFTLVDARGVEREWIVTTPPEETPTHIISARAILTRSGILGPEQTFSLKHLEVAADAQGGSDTAGPRETR